MGIHIQRDDYRIITNVPDSTPTFAGQIMIKPGTNQFYLAKGTAGIGDWSGIVSKDNNQSLDITATEFNFNNGIVKAPLGFRANRDIQLAQDSVLLPDGGGQMTSCDILRLRNSILAAANEEFHFITNNGARTNIYAGVGTFTNLIARDNIASRGRISGMGNIGLERSSVYIPANTATSEIDNLRLGNVILAGGSSAHFITNAGQSAEVNAKKFNVQAIFYNNTKTVEANTQNVFDIIDNINVVQTDEGLVAVPKKTKKKVDNHCITRSIDSSKQEVITMKLDETIAVLIKSVQELKKENEELKAKVDKYHP